MSAVSLLLSRRIDHVMYFRFLLLSRSKEWEGVFRPSCNTVQDLLLPFGLSWLSVVTVLVWLSSPKSTDVCLYWINVFLLLMGAVERLGEETAYPKNQGEYSVAWTEKKTRPPHSPGPSRLETLIWLSRNGHTMRFPLEDLFCRLTWRRKAGGSEKEVWLLGMLWGNPSAAPRRLYWLFKIYLVLPVLFQGLYS